MGHTSWEKNRPLNGAIFSDINDDRSCLKAEGWTSWLPQAPSRPALLWVPSVASLRRLGVNETQQAPAFSGSPTVPKEAVPAQLSSSPSNKRLHPKVSQVNTDTGTFLSSRFYRVRTRAPWGSSGYRTPSPATNTSFVKREEQGMAG